MLQEKPTDCPHFSFFELNLLLITRFLPFILNIAPRLFVTRMGDVFYMVNKFIS